MSKWTPQVCTVVLGITFDNFRSFGNMLYKMVRQLKANSSKLRSTLCVNFPYLRRSFNKGMSLLAKPTFLVTIKEVRDENVKNPFAHLQVLPIYYFPPSWCLIKDSQKSTCNSVYVSIAVAWHIYTIYVHAKSLQLCLTLCVPMDYSLPGSSVHGILQARILEWVAISFSRGSSQPRDQTCISWHWQVILHCWATREAQSNYTPIKITLKKEVNMQCFQTSFLFFLFYQ